MIAKILISSALLSYVIDLNVWQGITVVLFSGLVYFTGKKLVGSENNESINEPF